MTPIPIFGSSLGLDLSKKPVMLTDQAFQRLENAYVFRERVVKRNGLQLLGRLRRIFMTVSIGNSSATTWTFNLFSVVTPAIIETNKELQAGSVIIIFNGITFTDQGNGLLTSPTAGNSGIINYSSGSITLIHTGGAGNAATASFNYYPSLPTMGIKTREISTNNDEQTIFFDQKYAYIYVGDVGDPSAGFQEFIPGTTWNATDSDFFWAPNYQGTLPNNRLMFVSDFDPDSVVDPMYYTDGSTWTPFTPVVSNTGGGTPVINSIYSAQFIVPYYGRLLLLNTWEGTSQGGATNFFNQCRFSQIGSPVNADAFRVDIFGKGGSITAPVNEVLTGVEFIKNTLICFFEYSTWQLRFLGNYGDPFRFERVSSDFGSASPFSGILFNDGVLAVGDRAILSANSINVERIDLQIPDLVFDINNQDFGDQRVCGIRDYEKELIYWSYTDSNSIEVDTNGVYQKFPNTVLVYNYRNQTFAKFDDSVTAFGEFQTTNQITWDNLQITWDNYNVTWDDIRGNNAIPYQAAGNQQGFISLYNTSGQNGANLQEDPSLSITGINLAVSPVQFKVVNHNMENLEFVYLTDANFIDTGVSPQVALTNNLNNNIYRVTYIDNDTITLSIYNFTTNAYADITPTSIIFSPIATTPTYVGGGRLTLLPVLYVQTKDFNPFQTKGKQMKFCYADLLMDASSNASMSIEIFINSAYNQKVNLLTGNQELETSLTSPYYVQASQYAWHRFFATASGQYVSLSFTFDDLLMNNVNTHRQDWQLNALILYCRSGGTLPF